MRAIICVLLMFGTAVGSPVPGFARDQSIDATEAGKSLNRHGSDTATSAPQGEEKPLIELVPEWVRKGRRWSAAFGVAIIGDTTVKDYAQFNFNKLDGDGGGLTYNLIINYTIHEMEWKVGRVMFRSRVEVPFMLTLVDDGEYDCMPDFNLGAVLRWRDCPWNRWVYTTLAIGVGISYSTELWTGDLQRHPGDTDRSKWKFWLPIEVTIALPRHPQHQLLMFIDHQSGGHIFDDGGVDAWGFGYRFVF